MPERREDIHFEVRDEAIEPLIAELTRQQVAAHPETGATVHFEGWVRNSHKGRRVTSLSYSAYERLADTEGYAILGEAVRTYGLTFASAVHRTGDLSIGEMSIWIIAGAAHRGTAFEGCRYLIEEMKRRLPVWKHEFYDDGNDDWVHAGS